MANMEDVLDLYAEPYDPQRPVVCFDETSTQLLAETRPSLPPRPGLPLRQDYEYRREGTRNLFLACEPLAGWRQVAVTQRRTMQDFAQQMRWLVDEAYPEAEVLRVVMDNLNTHRPASLYETFPAAEARRIAKRLEFHYTPKHGSWLNMAEIEFSVLSRSCLRQRLPGEEALRREVNALVTERNAAQATINWRFNTQDARTKLHRLYPSDFTVDYQVTKFVTRRSRLQSGVHPEPGPDRVSEPTRSPAGLPAAWRRGPPFDDIGSRSTRRQHQRIPGHTEAWSRRSGQACAPSP